MPDGKTDQLVLNDVELSIARATGEPDLLKSCGGIIADGAAQGIAKKAGYEDDLCDMHTYDKAGKSCVADLTRTKKKKVINPFPECQELLKRIDKLQHICK